MATPGPLASLIPGRHSAWCLALYLRISTTASNGALGAAQAAPGMKGGLVSVHPVWMHAATRRVEQLSAGTAKAGFRCSFNHHDCSGTASQVTPQGRHQHVNASSGKVGFELATDGIQLYVFANSLNIPRCYPYRSTLPAPVGSRPAAHAWPGPGRHPG